MIGSILAISIRQPWTELILLGKKNIELRSWSTDYRGQLWLHTGLKGDLKLEKKFGLSNLFKGGYMGIITLDAVIPMDPIRWQSWQTRHLHPGPYRSDVYAWVLSSPHRFKEPIPGIGKLGLFSPSPDIESQLHKANFV